MGSKKVAITTLGCKVNQYESSSIAEMFRTRGYQVVDFGERADVYVINTCTVTHLGDRKSRQLIRRAVRSNPEGLVVVTGCYAQVSPGEVLDIPGVDLVVGTAEKARLVDRVEEMQKGRQVSVVREFADLRDFEELPAVAATGRTRAFLKIQEGCNNYCAYCIVPYARGPLRSRDPGRILEEAGKMAEAGYREIVLTGIHTGAYGKDKPGGPGLAALLDRLSGIRGLDRIRLSSVEPMDVNEELLEVLSRGLPFCPHLHIPLQSGDDQILAAMKRHYTAGDFKRLVGEIKDRIRDVAVTTDIIVGFPGETEDNFMNTYRLTEEMGFAGLHVFRYSPRKGTAAASMAGQVTGEAKDRRSRRLIELGSALAGEFASRYSGREVEVLVEDLAEGRPGLLQGHTPNYLLVVFPGDEALKGQIVRVRAGNVSGGVLEGRKL